VAHYYPYLLTVTLLLGFPDIRQRWQRGHQPHGFKAHPDHLAHRPHDVLLIVGPVRVRADAVVLRPLVLVDDPSSTLRLPSRYWKVSGGMPASVRDSFTFSDRLSLLQRILSSTR